MRTIVFCALIVAAAAFDFPEEWEAWKKEHNKVYSTEMEELTRHIIWQSNKKYIDEHNAHEKVFGFTLGLNKFCDLSSAEFGRIYNGLKGAPPKSLAKPVTFSGVNLPDSVDWRTKGFVTPIKDQGQCGSCWAFSAVATLEGQHFNATGKLVSLSEQNLVDCSTAQGNEGCNGGWPDWALNYVISNGGIDTESSYPYAAQDETCQYSTSSIGSTCYAVNEVAPTGNEAALQDAVATVGPVSVCIDASHTSFQTYKSGVYDPLICSSSSLDHAVLAVGYGSSGSSDYWIVKNSWGTTWGQDGYIWMARNKNNKCGIATRPCYPTVESS
eukprot:Em0017g884a